MPERDPATLAFLQQRQSVPAKTYVGPEPGRAELGELLEIALRVPDHGKLEPWRLIVLGPEDFARLGDMAEARARRLALDSEATEKGRRQYDFGRLAVVVISSPRDTGRIPLAEQRLSAGALCMNIVTTASAAGWSANWLSGWPSHDAAFIAEAFGCTPEESVAGIIHIGTARSPAPERPRPDPARVVRWGLDGK